MEVTVTEVNSKIPNKPPAEQLALPLRLTEQRRIRDPVPEALVRQFLRLTGASAVAAAGRAA